MQVGPQYIELNRPGVINYIKQHASVLGFDIPAHMLNTTKFHFQLFESQEQPKQYLLRVRSVYQGTGLSFEDDECSSEESMDLETTDHLEQAAIKANQFEMVISPLVMQKLQQGANSITQRQYATITDPNERIEFRSKLYRANETSKQLILSGQDRDSLQDMFKSFTKCLGLLEADLGDIKQLNKIEAIHHILSLIKTEYNSKLSLHEIAFGQSLKVKL